MHIHSKWYLYLLMASTASAAETFPHYFGHPAEADRNGVIAPWYKRQNGQYDYRVRIAAETLKRYPWAGKDKAIMAAPEYVFNGHWVIDQDGNISAAAVREWDNGDLSQRASYIIGSLMDYYMYTGDPAVFTPIDRMAEYLIDFCQTEDNHGWPRVLISVPTMGKHYGRCLLGTSDDLRASQGKIQLDNLAQVAVEFVRAYEMTGNTRWYEAAKHWADLLAQNRNRVPGAAPWGRYANNAGGRGMNDIQTGGVAIVLNFLEELIRTGYTGNNNSLIEARDAGRAYLRDVLLPAWYGQDTWGRNFWDWECPVQDLYGTEYPVQYLMDHKDYFPNWKNDVRNILSLFITHASVSPSSNADVFHGAWAYPESSGCCGRSLWYSPMELAASFARYGVEADSEWAREIARRSQLLATYDPRADGSSMDLIDGGVMVNRTWFKIAHPMALKYVLRTIAWLPEVTGANRENHIVRSSGVVRRVVYGKGKITYSTFDARSPAIEVLRLSYVPTSIAAGDTALHARQDLSAPGYTVRSLPNGDAIVSIRHDGATEIAVSGSDPQTMVDDKQLSFEGKWHEASSRDAFSGTMHVTAEKGAAVTYRFQGNQVRLVGSSGPRGGLADIFLDDQKQLVPIDCHSPAPVYQQILYYRNGLNNGAHTLKVVARGAGNPISKGTEVYIDGAQSSEATCESGFGEGGGPTGAQRMIFGYPGRQDYIDSAGNAWRPATEFIARTGHLTDVVAKTWWTLQQVVFIDGRRETIKDQELYRYGVHYKDFRVPLTVGPGNYHVRLKFAETQFDRPRQRAMSIWINGQRVVEGLDVFATAGAMNAPVDLVYNNIQPKNGVIEIRLAGDEVRGQQCEATLQALEVGPGDGGSGAIPKTLYPD
jgi:hypothetical protein